MSLTLLRFLAMTIGPAITAAARPAATFLGVQIIVALLVAQDLATLPQMMQWLVSVPAIVVAAVLAGLETAAKHDPDIAAILRDVQLDNLTGAFGAFTAALLFAALGMPEAQAAGLIEGGVDPIGGGDLEGAGGLFGATATAASSEQSTALQVGAVGGAVGLNLGLTWMRSQILEFVDDFELGKVWARVETGGVIGVLILLPLLPLLAFGFLVFFALFFAAVAFAVRLAQKAADRRARVACDTCDYQVRVEATLCPECKTEREPVREHRSGLAAAMDALRRRNTVSSV
jgi:hypothetical protein